MPTYKSIEELEDVPYPDCFYQCAVANLSNNAFACCEVHCSNKLIQNMFLPFDINEVNHESPSPFFYCTVHKNVSEKKECPLCELNIPKK
jgi:hypothetical protein